MNNEEIIIVECPECESRYRVDKKLITKPRTVRCINCSYIWLYKNQDLHKDFLSKNNFFENNNFDENLVREDFHQETHLGDFDYDENLEENISNEPNKIKKLEEKKDDNQEEVNNLTQESGNLIQGDNELLEFNKNIIDNKEKNENEEGSSIILKYNQNNNENKDLDNNDESYDQNSNILNFENNGNEENQEENYYDEQNKEDEKENDNDNEDLNDIDKDYEQNLNQEERNNRNNEDEDDLFAELFSQLDKIKNTKNNDDSKENTEEDKEIEYKDEEDEDNDEEDEEDEYNDEEDEDNDEEDEEDEYNGEEDEEILEKEKIDNKKNNKLEINKNAIDTDVNQKSEIDLPKEKEDNDQECDSDSKNKKVFCKIFDNLFWVMVFILITLNILFGIINFSSKPPMPLKSFLEILNIKNFDQIEISNLKLNISNHKDYNNFEVFFTILNQKNTEFLLKKINIIIYDEEDISHNYQIIENHFIKSKNYKNIYCKIPFIKYKPKKIEILLK